MARRPDSGCRELAWQKSSSLIPLCLELRAFYLHFYAIGLKGLFYELPEVLGSLRVHVELHQEMQGPVLGGWVRFGVQNAPGPGRSLLPPVATSGGQPAEV